MRARVLRTQIQIIIFLVLTDRLGIRNVKARLVFLDKLKRLLNIGALRLSFKAFQQRMDRGALRQKNAGQVGVPVEANTEHIEDFSFVPIRGFIDRSDAWSGVFLLRDKNFNAGPLGGAPVVEMVHELKTFGKINGRERLKEI